MTMTCLCGSRERRCCAVSACIHLALYLTGYRSIPTIGWLFCCRSWWDSSW
jgi:hypothetical protein